MVKFASSQQSHTELRLYFGVCILQQFQQSSHRDGRFACGGYSLRACLLYTSSGQVTDIWIDFSGVMTGLLVGLILLGLIRM